MSPFDGDRRLTSVITSSPQRPMDLRNLRGGGAASACSLSWPASRVSAAAASRWAATMRSSTVPIAENRSCHTPLLRWAAVETDRIIASIAAGQHAAVGRRQLLEAGVPAHAIGHRVRDGRLVPLHAGVYRLPGSPVTWHQRIMAATLAAGAGAVASHRAAGFLHGLEGIEPKREVSV